MVNDEPYYTQTLHERAVVHRLLRDEIAWAEADEPSVSREEERAEARPVAMEPLAAREYPDGPPAQPIRCTPDPGLDFPETGHGKNADAQLPEKFMKKGKFLRPWDQTTLCE